MLNILNKIWQFGRDSKATEAFIEVVDIVTSLKDSAATVRVSVDGAANAFDSKIIALNVRHRVIVIDSPPRKIELPSLYRGRPMTISTSSQGREIKIRSSFLEPFLPDADMGYQIAMPVNLAAEQTRGAFRVLLDELQQKVGVTLLPSPNQQVVGIVRNISRSGVGLSTNSDVPLHRSQQQDTVACRISFNETDNINCEVEIRNVQKGKTNGGTYVGGRMLNINRRDYDRLNDFIAHLQNQRLKALVSAA